MSMSDMTAALDALHADGWTTDDLDALPEDGRRRELIDGVLLMTPSPTPGHQSLAAFLTVRLAECCPPKFRVTQGVEVRINRRNSFIPDVLVVTAEAYARDSRFHPDDVVLAVEIVSPSTKRIDRVLKPSIYAEVGIPFYWRIETAGGVLVHTHKLGSPNELYIPTGEFSESIQVDEPWPISVRIADVVGHGSV